MRVVVGIHQGRDTYNEHTRKKNLNDFYYNSRYYDDRYQAFPLSSTASTNSVAAVGGFTLVVEGTERCCDGAEPSFISIAFSASFLKNKTSVLVDHLNAPHDRPDPANQASSQAALNNTANHHAAVAAALVDDTTDQSTNT